MPPKKSKKLKKSHLTLVSPRYTLSYGMRIDPGVRPEKGHAYVPVLLPDGGEGEMALHTISGTKREIKNKLLQSIDAFFDIHDHKKIPGGGE